jgi:hypothetical protein
VQFDSGHGAVDAACVGVRPRSWFDGRQACPWGAGCCTTTEMRNLIDGCQIGDQVSYSACQIGPSVSYWQFGASLQALPCFPPVRQEQQYFDATGDDIDGGDDDDEFREAQYAFDGLSIALEPADDSGTGFSADGSGGWVGGWVGALACCRVAAAQYMASGGQRGSVSDEWKFVDRVDRKPASK